MRTYLVLIFTLFVLSANVNAQWTGGGNLGDPMQAAVSGLGRQSQGSSGRGKQKTEGILTIGRGFYRSDAQSFLDPGWAVKLGGLSYLNIVNRNLPIEDLRVGINWTLLGVEWFPFTSNTSGILSDPDASYLTMLSAGIGPSVSYRMYKDIEVNAGLSFQPTILTLTNVESPFFGTRIGFHGRIKYTQNLFTGFDYTWGDMSGVIIESTFGTPIEVDFPTRRFEIVLLGISF